MRPEDLLALAFQIVAAEEGARQSSEALAEALAGGASVQVQVSPSAARTRRLLLRDVELPNVVADVRGGGRVRELVLKSKTKAFGLYVEVDGEALYNDDFSWFSSVSQEMEGVDAFEEDGIYVLRLSDISFAESFKAVAWPAPSLLLAGRRVRLDEALCVVDVNVKAITQGPAT